MILHTVNKAPSNRCLASCLRVAAANHAILLIEDGVYAAVVRANVPDTFYHHKLYALSADVKARGLSGKIAPQVELIDYAGFVRLTEQYDKVQSWY